LQTHIISKKESHLSLYEKLKRAWKWNSESIIIKINDVINTDIFKEREDSEVISEDFIKNLEVKNIENKLENEY